LARYREAVCRLCRREGIELYLKGDRCFTDKCAIKRRGYPPGQHGQRRPKHSDYGVQLREKQKIKRIYGLSEKQFHLFFERADHKKGITGTNLLVALERRLDNVVYRAHFAESRAQARQLVSHGHFRINGRRVTVPSLRVRPGDVVTMREASKEIITVQHSIDTSRRTASEWLEVEPAARKITITRLPSRAQIDTQVQEQLIVELYSK